MQIRERPLARNHVTGWQLSRACTAVLIVLVALHGLSGCASDGANGEDTTLRDLEEPVPLPGMEDQRTVPADAQLVPRIIVQRLDVPLDQPLAAAWTHIDEKAFPAITRGAWHANGLRVGMLYEDQVADFADQVPQVVSFFEKTVVTRSHPVAIMQAAPLSPDTRFTVDLTLPPEPPSETAITGRRGGQLQLLVQMQSEGDRRFVVLTPHLYRPQPNDFTSRPLLERDLDGILFHELAVRVELMPDRLVAVGLYWPWPESDPIPQPQASDDNEENPDPATDAPGRGENGAVVGFDSVLTSLDRPLEDDPAAPPQRIRNGPGPAATPAPSEPEGQAQDQPAQAMPALPMHFGRVLLTGTRARRPVQTMLLISIPPLAEQETPASRTGDEEE
ncbi:MAG: hypothetical protein AAGC44_04755 [Planctomycetota bacterium]